MSAEDLYGVFFEDSGDTYLVAIFGARGDAESYAEREDEDRFVREVENGETAEEDFEEIYEVEEVDPEWLTDHARDQLERGNAVRVS